MNGKKIFFARAALVSAPVIWGISFVMMDDMTGEVIDVLPLLALRFLSSAAVLSIILMRSMRSLDMRTVRRGATLGALLFLSYTFQTYGLQHTTPGKNAFLTGVYVVLVPFIHWLISGRRPTAFNIIAAFMSICGIGVVSLGGGVGSVNIGDVLTLIGGVMYAVHIVCANRFMDDDGEKPCNPLTLAVMQFAFGGAYALVGALITGEGFKRVPHGTDILTLAYLCIMCTAVALLFQNIGQKYTPPALASVILCTESALGFLFSCIMGREEMSARLFVGFFLVFGATLICEMRPRRMKNVEEKAGQLT